MMSKQVKPPTADRTTSPCCRARLLRENIAGMLVWREVDGRAVYSARCEKCRMPYDLDGGKAR